MKTIKNTLPLLISITPFLFSLPSLCICEEKIESVEHIIQKKQLWSRAKPLEAPLLQQPTIPLVTEGVQDSIASMGVILPDSVKCDIKGRYTPTEAKATLRRIKGLPKGELPLAKSFKAPRREEHTTSLPKEEQNDSLTKEEYALYHYNPLKKQGE